MAPPPFPPVGYSEDFFKRVRALFGGKYVLDAEHPKLVWEHAYWPVYYVPQADVKQEYLQNGKTVENGTQYDLVAGGESLPGAVTVWTDGPFAGWTRVTHKEPVVWFEEDERIWIHPRDPYKRVTILKSSKHIRVEIDGVEMANTKNSFRLYETGFPVRTYIPMTDVRLDLLSHSDKLTACPYKGDASYYDVNLPNGTTKSGLVWWYKSPIMESAEIKGHIAFYDEKVDVWVDGDKQPVPVNNYGS